MPLHQDEKYPHQFTFTVRLNMNHHAPTIEALQKAIAQAAAHVQGGEDPCKRVLMQLVELYSKGRKPVQFGSAEELLLYTLEQRFFALEELISAGFTETLQSLANKQLVGTPQQSTNGNPDEYEDMPDAMLNSLFDEE
jgi:hypothetical protein